jgi:hypothetical protein
VELEGEVPFESSNPFITLILHNKMYNSISIAFCSRCTVLLGNEVLRFRVQDWSIWSTYSITNEKLTLLLSVSSQVRAKFGTCTVVGLNAYIHPRMYALYLQQVSLLKQYGANAKFSTSRDEIYYSVYAPYPSTSPHVYCTG